MDYETELEDLKNDLRILAGAWRSVANDFKNFTNAASMADRINTLEICASQLESHLAGEQNEEPEEDDREEIAPGDYHYYA